MGRKTLHLLHLTTDRLRWATVHDDTVFGDEPSVKPVPCTWTLSVCAAPSRRESGRGMEKPWRPSPIPAATRSARYWSASMLATG